MTPQQYHAFIPKFIKAGLYFIWCIKTEFVFLRIIILHNRTGYALEFQAVLEAFIHVMMQIQTESEERFFVERMIAEEVQQEF